MEDTLPTSVSSHYTREHSDSSAWAGTVVTCPTPSPRTAALTLQYSLWDIIQTLWTPETRSPTLYFYMPHCVTDRLAPTGRQLVEEQDQVWGFSKQQSFKGATLINVQLQFSPQITGWYRLLLTCDITSPTLKPRLQHEVLHLDQASFWNSYNNTNL